MHWDDRPLFDSTLPTFDRTQNSLLTDKKTREIRSERNSSSYSRYREGTDMFTENLGRLSKSGERLYTSPNVLMRARKKVAHNKSFGIYVQTEYINKDKIRKQGSTILRFRLIFTVETTIRKESHISFGNREMWWIETWNVERDALQSIKPLARHRNSAKLQYYCI